MRTNAEMIDYLRSDLVFAPGIRVEIADRLLELERSLSVAMGVIEALQGKTTPADEVFAGLGIWVIPGESGPEIFTDEATP